MAITVFSQIGYNGKDFFLVHAKASTYNLSLTIYCEQVSNHFQSNANICNAYEITGKYEIFSIRNSNTNLATDQESRDFI